MSSRAPCQRTADGAVEAGSDVGREGQTDGGTDGGTEGGTDGETFCQPLETWVRRPPGASPAVHPSVLLRPRHKS